MSALGVAESVQPKLGTWSTSDPFLVCTLGTLGFPTRGTLPIMIAYDAKRIVAVTKKGVSDVGSMNDLATMQVVFVYEINHPNFGRLTCTMVAYAHALAKLRQKKETSSLDNAERAELADLTDKVQRAGVALELQFVIQQLYDHICNWHVMCESVQELNKNPFLRFSRSIARNGVAVTLNPLEAEPTANRRSEKLFRES